MRSNRMRTVLTIVVATVLQGCVPVLKTVQPSAEIVVTDERSVPIAKRL